MLTKKEKEHAELEKVKRFISRAQYWQIYLDQEMDRRLDQTGYKDSKEQYNVYQEGDTMLRRIEEQRQD